jgi:hypothetical protein
VTPRLLLLLSILYCRLSAGYSHLAFDLWLVATGSWLAVGCWLPVSCCWQIFTVYSLFSTLFCLPLQMVSVLCFLPTHADRCLLVAATFFL